MFDHKTNVVSQADFSYGNFERIEKTSQDLSLQQLENTQKSETKKTKEKCKKHKGSWRTSIGVKLISIISSLVVLSMGLITFLVSFFVTADTKAGNDCAYPFAPETKQTPSLPRGKKKQESPTPVSHKTAAG